MTEKIKFFYLYFNSKHGLNTATTINKTFYYVNVTKDGRWNGQLNSLKEFIYYLN